jgi:hypothetical protein
MPWELTVRSHDRAPLGDLVTVQQALTEAFPGAEFYRRPSGLEMVRQMYGDAATPRQLERFARIPAAYCGAFNGERFSVEFGLGPVELIESVALAVWGDREAALPLLERLIAVTGWDVDQQGFSGWEPYRE